MARRAGLLILLGVFNLLRADELVLPLCPDEKLAPAPILGVILDDEYYRKQAAAYGTIETIMRKVEHGTDDQVECQVERLSRNPAVLSDYLSHLPQVLDTCTDPCDASSSCYPTQCYSHDVLSKSLSLSLRDVSIEEALNLVFSMIGISCLIVEDVAGHVKQVDFSGVSAGRVLRSLLEHNDPPLALLYDEGIFHVVQKKDVERLAPKLLATTNYDFKEAVARILHQNFSECFKIRIEKMWYGITRECAPRKGYYLVCDDQTKKVFVRGREDEVDAFLAYLKEIDLPLPQVKIEARMIIACKSFEETWGTQWSSLFNRRAGIKRGVEFVGSGPLHDIQNDPMPQSRAGLMDWALNLFPAVGKMIPNLHLPLVIGGSDLETKRLNIVLNASEDSNEIRTILRPTLLTNHNEEAEILVGEKIPIQVIVKESIEGSLRDITTVNYKDVGVKLRVKPIVSPSGEEIFLEIYVENSSTRMTRGRTCCPDFPTIETIRSASRVILKNGQTTLISGLIQNTKSNVTTGIPILSKIPVLGYLFGGYNDFEEDKELMIFITPTIIQDANDLKGPCCCI